MTVITLREPISTAEGVISTVMLRRPKVKDLKKVDAARAEGGDMQAGIAMVAAITGLSVEVVDEMDAADFTTISEALADFFQPASR